MQEKSSRREFFSTMVGGIAGAWGGVRLVASHEVFAAPQGVSGSDVIQKPFVCGATFYRPPDPSASERRGMLKTIAEKYKFNTVRIFTSWAYVNPTPGQFEFSELDEVMRYCDEFGLKVLMGVMLEDAPYWLEAAHPECRYVNANGNAQRLGGALNNVSAGSPGLCLDWAPVRDAAADYIRATAKLVSAHPSLHSFDCWNEPHTEPTGHHLSGSRIDLGQSFYCYCAQTVEAFRAWLQKRYGTLDRLSKAWTRRYPSWSVIDPPRRLGTYPDWMDWLRFIIDRNAAELRFRIEQVRAVNSHSLLECHIGLQVGVESPVAILGVNPWQLADLVETWGVSLFPGFSLGPIYRGSAKLELTRCQARDKPFWISELQGGYAGGSFAQTLRMRPRDIRLWNWIAVATGAKGIIYWRYSPGTRTEESGGFGLVALDGAPTERVLEAAEDCRLIQAHWDLIEHYKPRPEVAIVFDQDSALLTFSGTGDEEISTLSFRGYYKALWYCDLWVDFIESAALSNDGYKLIIAPWHVMAKKETCARLLQFTQQGGTLVLETGFGMHDEHAAYNPIIPPNGLAEAFGYRELESLYIPTADIKRLLSESPIESNIPPFERSYLDEGYLSFTDPIRVNVKAHTFITPVMVGTATVIATYDSKPVAVKQKVGQGLVYYVGTNLGASIEAGDQGALDLVRGIVTRVVRPLVSAQDVRPRLIEGKDRSLLVVVNESSEERRSQITLPPRYQSATDLYSNEKQHVQNHAISVVVPFEGVSVVLLE